MSPEGLVLLAVQVLAVLSATRLCSALARRCGQPGVMGEIVGGLLLGPSFMGWLWPGAQALVFPAAGLAPLKALSQAGLVLFMFSVGARLDSAALKARPRAAVWISHASIVVPFLLGVLLAASLYARRAPAGVAFLPFALFIGVAVSVTAFPVLARILHEKGLSGKPLGGLVLACAAVDDVTAWCLLAAVSGLARGAAGWGVMAVVAAALVFVCAMLLAARPALARLMSGRALPKAARAAAAVLLAAASAWVSERIGIHALFGAFLAGAVWPERLDQEGLLGRRVEAAVAVVLLPLFFALTGLRTRVSLVDGWAAWRDCGAILLVAVLGKLGGASLAARFTGRPWRESLAVGALMNARGLVELVVLTVGLDLGVIGPDLFAMMVLMALATTLMTGPLVDLLLDRPA